MSYWLEDVNGDYLGDFATNRGIIDLYGTKLPALTEFLGQGECTESLAREILEEVKPHSNLHYIADLIGKGKFPIYITDGCGSIDTETE